MGNPDLPLVGWACRWLAQFGACTARAVMSSEGNVQWAGGCTSLVLGREISPSSPRPRAAPHPPFCSTKLRVTQAVAMEAGRRGALEGPQRVQRAPEPGPSLVQQALSTCWKAHVLCHSAGSPSIRGEPVLPRHFWQLFISQVLDLGMADVFSAANSVPGWKIGLRASLTSVLPTAAPQ